jgi:hypothetical protein
MFDAGATALSTVLRLVSTVAVLAVVYFLIVKPILNTTEIAVNGTARQSRQQQVETRRAQAAAERQRALGYARGALAGSQPWFGAARETRRCVEDAARSLGPLRRCTAQASAIVTRVQSPRNFSLSYAQSLDAQGKNAAADRVRACVDAAGFRVRPMLHCRALSDRLLFG